MYLCSIQERMRDSWRGKEREAVVFISLHRYTPYRVARGSNMAATTRPHKIHFKSEPIS